MDIVLQSLRDGWEDLLAQAPHLLAAAVVLLAAVLLGRLAAAVVGRLLQRGRLGPSHRLFFRALVRWSVVGIGLVVALDVVGLGTAAAGLLAGGGITALVVGFALRGIGENLLAGLFLAFSRPFEVGDLIESEDLRGVVRGIELRYTHIRAADGRDIYIPSAQIFNSPLTNYTRDGLRRGSFRVGIDYGDDPARARLLLLEATRAADGVLERPEADVVVADLAASTVELEVRFWVDTLKDGAHLAVVTGAVMEACHAALRDAGITFSSDVTTRVALSGSPEEQ